MKKFKYELDFANIPYQMHDEIVSKINLTEKSVQLCFDDIHFAQEHRKAVIEFLGMEDVSCALLMQVYEQKRTKISRGKVYFPEEFDDFFEMNKCSLIVTDILVGYGSFLITGKVIEGDVIGDKRFSLKIEAKTIEYRWF